MQFDPCESPRDRFPPFHTRCIVLAPPPNLDAISSAYVGHPTQVVCWTRGQFDAVDGASKDSAIMGQIDWDSAGDVPWVDTQGRYTIRLTRRICDDLHHPGRNASQWHWDSVSSNDQGYGPATDARDGVAFETFLHEMLHARLRNGNESVVECDTYKNRWAAIRLFRPMKRWVQKQIYWGMKVDHDLTMPNYREVC